MCGPPLKVKCASPPARSTMRANPAVLKGSPRSETNTCADLGAPLSGARPRPRSGIRGCAVGHWGAAGAVELAWDRDTDTVYVSRTHRLRDSGGLGRETATEKLWKVRASR